MQARRKCAIRVRDGDGNIVKIVCRVLRSEAVGNFSPVFCTYLGRKRLVESTLGDLSDPFRRTEEYLSNLFIRPRNGKGELTDSWS